MTHGSMFEGTETGRVDQAGREEGVVRTDAAPVTHERPDEWGWHGETGKWGRRGGVLATLFILAYLIGNHRGKVEDLWLIGVAFVMVLILVWDWRRRKNAWRAE